MGILDDAIREHLELKRKHGVAEEELQRQEEEALGPARRDVAQQHEETEPTPGHTATAENGEHATAAAAEETALFDMERSEVAADEPVAAAEPTPVEPPPVEPPPVEPDEPEAGIGDDEPELDQDDVLADEPEPDEDDMLADEPGDDAHEEEEEESGDEDADVLEDTPDFLQETPEHDRLWFEQKPPRDFDFD